MVFAVEYNHPSPEKQFTARGKFEKCRHMEYIFQQTAYITAKTRKNIMGQQINKIEKRRRRKAYLERCAERAKAAAKKK